MAWGNNNSGQTDVPVAAQSGVTAIAAGGYHTVALKTDGSVLAWGLNDYGQTDVPVEAQSGVTAIAAGGRHSVALKNDGSVVAWGLNDYGQVTGTPTTDVPYSATASPVTLEGQVLTGVTVIAAGGRHTVALRNDGSVVAWGHSAPAPSGLTGVTAIAAGFDHTVALKNDGSVVAWGYNSYGQTTVPAGLIGVTAIAAGGYHTVALIGAGLVMPSLTSRHSGHELVLSWSTNAVGFTLQSALNLTPPITWSDVTNAPALLGAQWTVTDTFSGSAQFYHLRKP